MEARLFPGVRNVGTMHIVWGAAISKRVGEESDDSDVISNKLREQFLYPYERNISHALMVVVDHRFDKGGGRILLVGNNGFALVLEQAGSKHRYFKAVKRIKFAGLKGRWLKTLFMSGDFRFVDRAEGARFETKEKVEGILEEGGLLAAWNKWIEVETEQLDSLKRSFGESLEYGRREYRGGGRLIRFYLSAARSRLAQFDDVLGRMLAATRSGLMFKVEGVRRGSGTYSGFDITAGTLDLQISVDVPEKGRIALDLQMAKTNLFRKQEAFNRLGNGNAAITSLPLILEGDPAVNRGTNVRTWSSERVNRVLTLIYDRLGAEAPNESQDKAIRAAIETPHIALIHGPPGTGKTKVVSVLVEALDLLEGGSGSSGILISSQQHVAVENALRKIVLKGLPAPKFGKKHGERKSAVNSPVENFLSNYRRRLEEKIASLPEGCLLTAIRGISDSIEKMSAFGESFGKSDSVEFLQKLLERIRIRIPEHLRHLCDAAEDKLISDAKPDPVKVLFLAEWREIDMSKETGELKNRVSSLLDEGCAREFYTDEEVMLLRSALDCSREDGFRRSIAEAVGVVVDGMSLSIAALPWKSILFRTLTYLRKSLEDELASEEPESYVLVRLLDRLEREPGDSSRALKKHVAAVGATCQQSVSSEIGSHRKDWREFETVVIDEAGRASPLDLIIPMSLARRRIVLIGDHKQLPHMVEEDLERYLEQRGEIDLSRRVRESLFEALHKKWMAIPEMRKSVVALNTQYRMPKCLGDILQRLYYSDSGLASAGDPVDFHHGLTGEFQGRHLVWLDCPASAGAESKHGYSRYRQVEVDAVLDTLTRLGDGLRGMSIGAIGFYRRQADLLKSRTDELHRRGTIPEEVYCGSVDEFQGREFDVVFLSTVRTSRDDLPDGFTENAARRIYGHLMIPNRQCVALSRQRKLLVIVGDGKLFQGAFAEEAVAGIAEFSSQARSNPEWARFLTYEP